MSAKAKTNVETDKKTKISESTEISVSNDESNAVEIDVEAEMRCIGHAPIEPTLRYLKDDPTVMSLISMRMDPNSLLTDHRIKVKLSKTSGMNEKEAIKVESAMNMMKASLGVSLSKAARMENVRYLQYDIRF